MSNFLKGALAKVQDKATHLIYGIEKKSSKMTFCSTVDKDMAGNERIDEYGARGFKVLAFPCNQFGGQEPGTHEEIIEFVKKIDEHIPEKVTFFEKNDVNGAKAREPFSFIKQACPNDDETTDIRWNFVKFLVDHEGNAYKRYASTPPDDDMRADIDALLKKKEQSS